MCRYVYRYVHLYVQFCMCRSIGIASASLVLPARWTLQLCSAMPSWTPKRATQTDSGMRNRIHERAATCATVQERRLRVRSVFAVCCVRSALWLSWPAWVFVRTWTTACCTFTRVDCASVCSASMYPHKRGKQVRKVRQFSCGVCTAPRMRASMLLAVDCCLKDSTHTRGCNTTRRCVPSRNEPFGIVVLEAWASGKVLSTCVHVCAHGMRTCAQVMLLYPWCVCVCEQV